MQVRRFARKVGFAVAIVSLTAVYTPRPAESIPPPMSPCTLLALNVYSWQLAYNECASNPLHVIAGNCGGFLIGLGQAQAEFDQTCVPNQQ